MKHILIQALHIFVIFMIAVFVIGSILALTGAFDHWAERYRLKRRRRRLLRGYYKNPPLAKDPDQPAGKKPFKIYKGKYI